MMIRSLSNSAASDTSALHPVLQLRNTLQARSSEATDFNFSLEEGRHAGLSARDIQRLLRMARPYKVSEETNAKGNLADHFA